MSHLVVIGASAGGVTALLEIAASLPRNFPAPVCVVLHVGARASMLPELLQARGSNPAIHAAEGQRLRPGTLYVAPPDHHMLVERHVIRLSRGPKENHVRPAIDPLFRSAAVSWGARTIGVVLTGQLDDGTAGLAAIKACGGTTLVQDPATAIEPAMPRSALANVVIDHCAGVAELAVILARLVGVPAADAGAEVPVPDAVSREAAINRGDNSVANLEAIATPSTLTCPDCGGTLWELKGGTLRYRCHTGHAFSASSLAGAQSDATELNLRQGVRALRERELLLRRMAAVSQATGNAAQARVGLEQADRLRSQVEMLLAMTESEDERLGISDSA